MKRWTYALTFERPTSGAPDTVRGEVVASNPSRALSRAYREAIRACPRRRWDDVVVLLEAGVPVTAEGARLAVTSA